MTTKAAEYTRPELPAGWQWEEGKISTAWGPSGMCTKSALGRMKCHGTVPEGVKAKVALAARFGRRPQPEALAARHASLPADEGAIHATLARMRLAIEERQ